MTFGDPSVVRAQFSQKLSACGLGAQGMVPAGYRFEAIMAPAGEDGSATYPAIRIYEDTSPAKDAYLIYFQPFNANTLITTRNVSLPKPVALRIQADIERWLFDSSGCGNGDGPAPRLQQASLSVPGAAQTGVAGSPTGTAASAPADDDDPDRSMHLAEMKARGAL